MSLKVGSHIIVNSTGMYEICDTNYNKYYAKLIGEGQTISYVFDSLEVLYEYFSNTYQNDFRILEKS